MNSGTEDHIKDFDICLLQQQRTMFQTVVLILITIPTYIYSSVQLKVQTDTFVLGNELKLICDTSKVDTVCEKCISRFHGGPNQTILAYNGYIENKVKYYAGEESNGFSLTIKDISFGDFNVIYTCSYGFEYDDVLLNLTNYELHPREETTNVQHKIDDDLNLHVRVELSMVYPEPTCVYILHNIKLEYDTLKTVERMENYFISSFTMMYNVRNLECEGHLFMECTVGSSQHIIYTDVLCEDIMNKVKKEIGHRDSNLTGNGALLEPTIGISVTISVLLSVILTA